MHAELDSEDGLSCSHYRCSYSAVQELLIEAGLGEKKIAVPDVEMLQDEFWSLIAGYFPKLEGCGGFELLRCAANSRCLEVILPKISGAIAGTSKTYICPTQQDLDLEPNVSESSFTEVFICIVCHSAVICMCTYMYMHVMDILS